MADARQLYLGINHCCGVQSHHLQSHFVKPFTDQVQSLKVSPHQKCSGNREGFQKTSYECGDSQAGIAMIPSGLCIYDDLPGCSMIGAWFYCGLDEQKSVRSSRGSFELGGASRFCRVFFVNIS